MIPLVKEDKHIEIGMVYPEDQKAREALEFLARQKISCSWHNHNAALYA